MTNWSTDQWIMFGSFTVAGVAALALLALIVRDRRRAAVQRARMAAWRTAHAVPMLTIAPAPNTLDRRALAEFEQRWNEAMARPVPVGPGLLAVDLAVTDTTSLAQPLHVDPTADVLEHVAPGPGALSSLQEVGPGALRRVTHDDIVDPEVAQWFAEAFDRPARQPRPDEARELDEGGLLTRWRCGPVAAAMQTAHLWEVQGRGHHGVLGAGRAGLDRWRIDCPTGEYAILTTADLGPMAKALLGS